MAVSSVNVLLMLIGDAAAAAVGCNVLLFAVAIEAPSNTAAWVRLEGKSGPGHNRTYLCVSRARRLVHCLQLQLHHVLRHPHRLPAMPDASFPRQLNALEPSPRSSQFHRTSQQE